MKEAFWLCEKCESKRTKPHTFDPDKSVPNDGGRSPFTNGQIAERAAVAICDYTGVCNPQDHDIADLIADFGHFCDREGHDFRSLVRSAINHWEAER